MEEWAFFHELGGVVAEGIANRLLVEAGSTFKEGTVKLQAVMFESKNVQSAALGSSRELWCSHNVLDKRGGTTSSTMEWFSAQNAGV